ncbi:hypothetical protein [Planotetraspora sp. GP83]|uniref:hypothetical protein n=1 Tax=Planotetraspora sp. GP83 TaxID=3156264 RepID=UPI003511B112
MQLTLDVLVLGPDIAELLAAAEQGPPAWELGVAEHLASRGRHGRSCFTCYCHARHSYGLDWTWD